MTLFFTELSLKPNVAFRKGELFFSGWTIEKWMIPRIREVYNKLKSKREIKKQDIEALHKALAINFKQKRVDIMIGLDIAWLSRKHIVDKIVLVTTDTDFIPAMKFARREGIQMIISEAKGDLK